MQAWLGTKIGQFAPLAVSIVALAILTPAISVAAFSAKPSVRRKFQAARRFFRLSRRGLAWALSDMS